jgi:hypothetical protein
MSSPALPVAAWRSSLLWLGTATITGVVVGMVSGALQQAGHSLWLLQPLALGGALAIALVGGGALLQKLPPRWSVMVAGLIAVATQHLWLYRAELAARRKAVNEQAMIELFKPGWSEEGFFSYIREYGARPNGANWVGGEWPNFVLWGIDACLLVASAMAIVEWYRRRYRVDGPGEAPGLPEARP